MLKERFDSDVLIYGKAKMKIVHVIESSKVEVIQFSNVKHDKQHESVRINIPDEVQNGEVYENAMIVSKRGISITEVYNKKE